MASSDLKRKRKRQKRLTQKAARLKNRLSQAPPGKLVNNLIQHFVGPFFACPEDGSKEEIKGDSADSIEDFDINQPPDSLWSGTKAVTHRVLDSLIILVVLIACFLGPLIIFSVFTFVTGGRVWIGLLASLTAFPVWVYCGPRAVPELLKKLPNRRTYQFI